MSVAGHRIVVSGGSGGLGRAVTLGLLSGGARVAVPYRSATAWEALRRAAGDTPELWGGPADIAHVVSEVRERLPDVPPAPSADPEQTRFRLFDGVTTFLKNASKTQALVIVLDDLHWADKPSLLLLQFLAREMRGGRRLRCRDLRSCRRVYAEPAWSS